jgi:hypothetical protein
VTPHSAADLHHLTEPHRLHIRQRSIVPHIALGRNYRSVMTKAELRRLGFTEGQCRVPALLLPVWSVVGEIANYQLRADVPRIDQRGKAVKYELPRGAQMLLDAHPLIREQLSNPAIPLWITEGNFKADAAISAGLCCIALLGVWNWRGTNGLGGKTALPEWELIALNGRESYVAFDSDSMTKPQVHAALARLGGFLSSRGAHVRYVYLPAGEGGIKVGLDDFLAAGHSVDDLLALASTELRRPPTDPDEASGSYSATSEGIVYRRPTQNGPVDQLLSNFTARIVEEVIADDGVSERGELVVAGELAGGVLLPRITVPIARFAAMEWPVQQWGTRTIVSAGMGTKDRVREAIQRLSPAVPQRRVYEHPGWREIPERGWCYLHAGGAIGADGLVAGIDVALSGSAGRIRLPDPLQGDELRTAVRTSLALLDLAPDAITAPLLAVVYRAVLCELVPADLSVFLVGSSGVYKSELAALVMQHVGAGFDRLHLPAHWSATPNFLERIGFDFKDAPVVIDDFAPAGSSAEVARLHATADRVLRGMGNRGGRGRMHADGSLRPDYPPRGLVLGTGEDAPRGHSLRARMVIIDVAPGDVNLAALSAAQETGRTGRLVAGLAGFLQWIAAHYEDLRASLPQQLIDFRAQALTEGAHARTPEAVAHLALGWSGFLRFAVAIEALSRDGAERLYQRVWTALRETATRQASQQAGEEPAHRFLDLLSSALAGGYTHLASGTGEVPPNAGAWGWRKTILATGLSERIDWQPRGARAGWLDENNVYLDLEAAHTAVEKVGQATGSPIGVTPKTLAKRLHERGFLASTEQAQGELRVRRTLEGRRRRVLHLKTVSITLEESGQPGQSNHLEVDSAHRGRISSDHGWIQWPDCEDRDSESGHRIQPARAGQRRHGWTDQIPQTCEAANDEGLSQVTFVREKAPDGFVRSEPRS